MITKLDIKIFGLFADYLWRQSVGDEYPFNRLNIIYGRNYSGKTTLSRVIQCLENKSIHADYPNAEFSITHDGHVITHDDLETFAGQSSVFVFNQDFVKENLGWLRNPDGSIKPFAVLGSKNLDVEKSIAEIDKELGDEISQDGLRKSIAKITFDLQEKIKEVTKVRSGLDNKLKDKAVEIKSAAAIYNHPVYTITNIRTDIEKASNVTQPTDEQKEQLANLLKDEPLGQIPEVLGLPINLEHLIKSTEKLLSATIEPTIRIEELISNQDLQSWVREGINLHEGKRDQCGFCGNELGKELFEKLRQHFNTASENLRTEINKYVSELNEKKNDLDDLVDLDRGRFYRSFQSDFDIFQAEWNRMISTYKAVIDSLTDKLNERLNDIFTSQTLGEFENPSIAISAQLKKLNDLIRQNNKKSGSLVEEQDQARATLRLFEVSRFATEIGYKSKLNDIRASEEENQRVELELGNLSQRQHILLNERKQLLSQLKDESLAAKLVNELIEKHFGHDQLKLDPIGESPNISFKVIRDDGDAKNLSEGECSLISFCYFMAKVRDYLDEHAIIFIDDPISSLDSNHVFFMFSLIDTFIAKPKTYKQLFISTHNLDFLKYLKRITVPDGPKSVSYFLAERSQRRNEKRCSLVKMPDHLRKYVTEFNYLFGQLLWITGEVNGDKSRMVENTFNPFYNLPNNMRKFLECYLFYKFPNNEKPLDNLEKLFDGNVPSLVHRVINEGSHLTFIERGWKPFDVPEIESCAKLILEKIKERDPEQYEALVESVS